MNHFFDIPPTISIDNVVDHISKKFTVREVSKQYSLKTYYDSFDWRLWRHDLICEFNRSQTNSILCLIDRKNNKLITSSALFDVPEFANQFNPGKVRHMLEPVLEMRAMQSIATVECEISQFDILDEDAAVIIRLVIEDYASLNKKLSIIPFNGRENLNQNLERSLTDELSISPSQQPILLDVLALQGRKPKDYSSKIDISLSPEMSTVLAWKTIFSHILRIIKVNEQGVIADTDSEFLHDFRVAVRRTRIGLNQTKKIFPDNVIKPHKEFFSWLGQITAETRDFDVQLLNFEPNKKRLPKETKQSINPLQHFLLAKKQKAHKALAQKLRSNKYKMGIKKWEEFLNAKATDPSSEIRSGLNAKAFADQKIWKLYKQIVKQGGAISKQSPPEEFHKIRKTCKKLRYMLEFFQNIYPEKKIERQLTRLKHLQAVLGNYQDFEVQQKKLEQFSDEMGTINIPNRTFLAMGVLIKDLEIRKRKTRSRFSTHFAKFNRSETQVIFKDLYKK